MKLIASSSTSLRGETHLAGDKSLSHRAALFGALADGKSKIHNFLSAGVTHVLLHSLDLLGIGFEMHDSTLSIEGEGLFGFQPTNDVIDCGNSATTMRLLTGALAASGIPAILDGSPGLRARPMRRLIEPLHLMGVPINACESGGAPLTLRARSKDQLLNAIHYSLPVASAQIKSALLLAALVADEPTILCEPGPSRDHTERMLTGMGVTITSRREGSNYITQIQPSSKLMPLDFTIPGDISSAAFLLVAALIVPDSEITVQGICNNFTRTGLLDALIEMGADINIEEKGISCGEPIADVTARYSQLNGVKVNGEQVVRMIDEFPIFAVAAAYAKGRTIVENAGELRHKESDRITDLSTELCAIGIDAKETFDGFIISGGHKPAGGKVNTHGDHRLAMSLAIAGLGAQNPVVVPNAEYIQESFPAFVDIIRHCGASMEIIE